VAVVASIATGNWLTAGTWGLVDSASYSNSETTGATPPTSSGATSRSNAFTPAAGTIDAYGIKFRNRTGTTGTMTVAIILDSDNSVQKTVTINMSDLPPATTAALDGGWIIFKPASGLVVDGLTAYKIDIITSSSNQASVFSSATNNWSRLLITSTTQAPVAGDDMIVAGNWTAAATSNAYTVTMNETAATDYGSNTTSPVTPALAICQNGTLTYNSGSAANPLLRLSGHAIVYSGGTLNIGTTGTPIPRDSSAVLEFDSTTDGGHGLIGRNGSIVNIQGLSRTSGKNIVSCKLNTDEAINSTSLGVDTDTGWLDNDWIAVASTTLTRTQCEAGQLNGNAGASTLTVNSFGGAGGGLASAHSGTSPTQAEVILLTRNVAIRSVSSTLVAYVHFGATAVVDIDWAQFFALGQNATNQRGIEVVTSTGSFSMQYSSIDFTEDFGFYVTGGSVNNIEFSNNVIWNAPAISGDSIVVANATSGTNIVFNNNIVMKGSGQGFWLGDNGITITNNTVAANSSNGFYFQEPNRLGTVSGNTAHSCGGAGAEFNANAISGVFSDFTAWRNSAAGIALPNRVIDFTIDSPVCFGNSTYNIFYNNQDGMVLYINNPVLNGDTSFATTYGLFGDGWLHTIDIVNGDFSTVAGIKTAHTTDIQVFGPVMSLTNTKLGAATQFGATPTGPGAPHIVWTSQRHNGTAGDHRTYMESGMVQTDSVIYHTAAPSQRCTPKLTTPKLASAFRKRGILAAVADTETVTVSVWVRKSIAGDPSGFLYAGNQPRLIVRANPAIGLDVDTVLDTMTVADNSGTWEELTGTTPAATDDGAFEFVVDCDGTSGAWINVDDWSVS
jgi:hypothetical protein